MIPIPKTQQNLLQNTSGNFSLAFPRLVDWQQNSDKLKNKDIAIVELCELGNKIIPNANDELKKIHFRQESILREHQRLGLSVFQFYAKLVSPYISGLGAGHPTETGMILDHNTGVPFIPASSVKGVLRLAHALNLAEHDSNIVKENDDGSFEISDNETTLLKYFGSTDTNKGKRGEIVFLDAYPLAPPILKTDIMNPHFSEYYKGNQPPYETEFPTPIKFLTVEEGTVLVFRCFVSALSKDSFNDSDKENIKEMFKRACTEIGFGGKTSIGYGRFSPPTEEPVTLPPKERSEAEKAFDELKKSKNQEKLIKFIECLKDSDIEFLNNLSFKGMEEFINIGIVPKIEQIKIPDEFRKIIAKKILEVCKQPDKKFQEKVDKYNKLKLWAGK